jgi:uncharacterized protein (TIGR03083 family)
MDSGDALVEQGRLLAAVTEVADPGTPVPTCPGWVLRQLVSHVGRGDRWAAEIVRTGGPVDTRAVPDGRAPDDPAQTAGWLRGGAELLVAAAAADPAKQVWTFLGPRPAAWWVRRRLHESTVHRADAALALGAPYDIDPALAADGIDEFLDVLAARPRDIPPLDEGASLHLHATDGDLVPAGEWVLRAADPSFTWEHGHEKADAAVRGSARDLFLAVTRRLPGDDPALDVVGAREVWTRFRERAAF